MTLVIGTQLAQGRWTVAAALHASGTDQATNWSCFHQGLLTFPTSPTDPAVVLVPRSTLERLSWAVCS
jgi:hypothetical protein